MRVGTWKIEECGDGGCEAYKVEVMMWMDIYLRTNVSYDFRWIFKGMG